MQLINIYPVGNLCMEYTQRMHMYLTHLVEKYEIYRNVARGAPGYRILDNSLIELGEATSVNRLLEAANTIGADEIILPDVFKDGPETLKAVEAAIKKVQTAGVTYKLMAVAQGKDIDEWCDCYKHLTEDYPEVSVIGVPKVLATMHPAGRPYIVNNYCNLDCGKEHHLLGIWYSLRELDQYDFVGKIRSCDSVLACYLAYYGLHSDGVRPDGFTLDLEQDTVSAAALDDLRKSNKRFFV